MPPLISQAVECFYFRSLRIFNFAWEEGTITISYTAYFINNIVSHAIIIKLNQKNILLNELKQSARLCEFVFNDEIFVLCGIFIQQRKWLKISKSDRMFAQFYSFLYEAY